MSDGNITSNKSRIPHWSVLAGFSTIALISIMMQFDGKVRDQDGYAKWAVTAICISLIFSYLAAFLSIFFSSSFGGTWIEGGLAIIIFIFWSLSLPAIMNPENELAILEFYEVNNANLYVSSWGGLITSFVTIVSFVQEKRGVSATVRPSTWGGLCITSFLVMISASRLYQNFDCKDRKDWGGWDESAGDEGDFVDMLDAICHRTQFAIGAGVISGVIAAVWLLIQLCAPGFRAVILEIIISVLMFIAWCFGVGFVTFGNNDRAPGADFGNLYFSTWGALVFCGMLVYGAIKRTGSSSDDGIVAPRMEGGNPVENESNDKRNAYENEYRA